MKKRWKIRGLKLGREKVRFMQNDNGYIQDAFREFECIKNDDDIRRENYINQIGREIEAKRGEIEAKRGEIEAKGREIQAKRGEIQAKRGEIQAKGREIEAKRRELQPLFTGEVDNIAVKTMLNFIRNREGQIRIKYTEANLTTNYYTIPSGRLLTVHLGLNQIELGFFEKADIFVKYQDDMLKAVKAANSSVTNYKFNPERRGIMMKYESHEFNALKEVHWQMFAEDYWTNSVYRSYRSRTSRVGFKRRIHHKTDGNWYLNYAIPRLRNISDIFWRGQDFENFYQKLQQINSLFDRIKQLEALIIRLEREELVRLEREKTAKEQEKVTKEREKTAKEQEKVTKERENHNILY